MAILFSKVTLTSGDKNASFLVSGAPASEHSLDGWTNYHSFVRSLDPHSHVVASGVSGLLESTSYTSP